MSDLTNQTAVERHNLGEMRFHRRDPFPDCSFDEGFDIGKFCKRFIMFCCCAFIVIDGLFFLHKIYG